MLQTRMVLPAGAMLTAILLVSAVLGWQKHATLNSARSAYAAVMREQWLNQPDRHPHRVSHYGQVVFRPESPLSYFDFGVNSFAGVSLYLEPHRQNVSNFSEARQSEGVLRFGELTMAIVLQQIVPLFIVFIGFGSVSREREDGTLPMLLGQGVTRRELLLGKSLGLLAVMVLALVPALALSTPLLATVIGSQPAGVLFRTVLLAAAHVAYYASLTMGVVLISYSSRTSRFSLVALLGLWTLLYVVIPRTLPSLAAQWHPVPSKAEFDAALEREIRETGDSHNPADPHFDHLKQRILAQYGSDSVENLPVNWGGIVMREAEVLGAQLFSRHYTNLMETFAKQNRISEWAGLLDPYLAMRHVSQALSNSSFADYDDFQQKAEAHRYSFVQRLNDIHANEVHFENDRSQRVSRDHWRDFPDFEYASPGIGWSRTFRGAFRGAPRRWRRVLCCPGQP